VKERSKLDTKKFLFSPRVVNSWNSLPAEVLNAASVNGFKNAYDRRCYNDMDDISWPACQSINLQVQVQVLRRSRLFKVTHFGTNRKLICDFLLVI